MAAVHDVRDDADGAAAAVARLADGREIPVRFAVDEVPPGRFELEATAAHALALLDADHLDRVTRDVAREFTTASLGGAGIAFGDDDVEGLRADLRLVDVVVLADATLMVRFTAPAEYPDGILLCQLDAELEIDDVSLVVGGRPLRPALTAADD